MKVIARRLGFTLIELSIVLVIIGLLIGGILAAKSIISSTKITRAVKDLQQYDIAVTNFQTKYNSLPGDSKLFGGNGNGMIDSTEVLHVWSDLSVGVSLMNKSGVTYSSAPPGGPFTTSNAPSLNLALPTSSGITTDMTLILQSYDITTGAQSNIANYIFSDTSSGIPGGIAIFPVDALALDKKIDDANPSSGKVKATNCNSGVNGPNVYDLTVAGCVIQINQGIFTGTGIQ